MTETLGTAPIRFALLACLLLLAPAAARGDLLSVDWDPDGNPDGLVFGALGPAPVTFISTDGPVDGGIVLGGDPWGSSLGTDDVPGIADPGVVSEGVGLDWPDGGPGAAAIAFGTFTVTDPILLFNFLDGGRVETFDFADDLSIILLDSYSTSHGGPDGVSLQAGNVLTTDGSHADIGDDGFAIRIAGTFTSLVFLTNLGGGPPRGVRFSVAAERADIVVPEPGTLSLVGVGLAGTLAMAWRRRRAGVSAARVSRSGTGRPVAC